MPWFICTPAYAGALTPDAQAGFGNWYAARHAPSDVYTGLSFNENARRSYGMGFYAIVVISSVHEHYRYLPPYSLGTV